MKRELLSVVSVAAALGAPDFGLAQTGPPRQPVGIYARVVVGGTDAQVTNNIAAILINPAISGILGVINWKDLSTNSAANPLAGSNDWRLTDDFFGAVGFYNSNNLGAVPKTIQLEITPGFNTPQWVFNNLSNCDAMFLTNAQGSIVNSNAQGLTLVGVNDNLVTNTCGCADFLEAEDFANPTVKPLPLPWNTFYKSSWKSFVQAVAGRYGTNPLLVSVTVAGPTASSAEMILPNEINDPTNYLKWNPLFALEFPSDASLTNSDAKFIKEWEDAIDVFGAAFSNLTLCVTTGMGLPNFLDTNQMPYTNYTVPPGFSPNCCDTNNQARLMDCAAETMILAYFMDPQNGGNNAKAIQENGLRAGEINDFAVKVGGDLDSYAMKWLAQNTTSGSAPLPGTTNVLSMVLGGVQTGGVITQNPQTVGCNQQGGCPTNGPKADLISPEQAIYNVLTVYFDGTPVGSYYGINPIVSSNLPLNYLQLYGSDISYASTNLAGSLVVDGFGMTNNMTAQMLLTNASFQFSEIAEFDIALNVQTVGPTVQLTWLTTTPATYQLQVNHNLSDPNGWKQASQTPTTNGDYLQVSITPNAAVAFFRLAPP
jgi:hypothetical protein